MKLVVFTTVLGPQTDPLRKPTIIAPSVRYLCFTDQAIMVPPYESILMAPSDDPNLQSRQIKILAGASLGPCDVSLWHDAAFRLTCDPRVLVPRLLMDVDMLALRHPHRTQIEAEADAIVQCGYVPRDVLDRQVQTYRAEGFTQTAITSTGLCLRRHTAAVAAFNATWWSEVARWHYRDQMSVDYALWKSQVKVAYMKGHYRENPYAKWRLHQPVRKTA